MKVYQDETWLREKYWDKYMTTDEMGKEAGVTDVTIRDWMERRGIERRDRSQCQIYHRAKPPTMNIDEYGYERFTIHNSGDVKNMRVHQLVAISEGANPYDLFGGGYDVHHKNEIPWDNRPENLEVIEHSEHRRLHALKE